MMLPTVSRRVMAKISWTPATVFDFFRDRGAELMKMLSGIGIKVLEELMLTFEASSCAMLMVVGGLWMDGRVRVRGDKLGGVWMMGGAEVYCVVMSLVADGGLGEKPGCSEGYFSENMGIKLEDALSMGIT